MQNIVDEKMWELSEESLLFEFSDLWTERF